MASFVLITIGSIVVVILVVMTLGAVVLQSGITFFKTLFGKV